MHHSTGRGAGRGRPAEHVHRHQQGQHRAGPQHRLRATTDRTDLACDVDILLAGLPVRASRQVLRSQFNSRLSAATRQRVEQLCEGYGRRSSVGPVSGRRPHAAGAGSEARHRRGQLIVPRLVEWLDEPTHAAVFALAALDKAEWGWPLLAAVADISTQSRAKSLLESKLAVGRLARVRPPQPIEPSDRRRHDHAELVVDNGNLNDYSFKDNTKIYVACYTAGGTPADTAFDLRYTSTRSY
jgi:hypothetical protein